MTVLISTGLRASGWQVNQERGSLEYLKSRIVLGGHHESSFATVIHPPIDRILLQGIAERLRTKDPVLAKQLRTTTWTSLTEAKHDDLIARLRSAGLDQPAFWWIEQFWDPRSEEV